MAESLTSDAGGLERRAMNNPIFERELIGMLRTAKAFGLLVAFASVSVLLVLLRWPSDPRVDLSGVQSQEVFRLFGYGILAALLMFVPAFPATTLVRERKRGTLALLLQTPMSPVSIYLGKALGVLAFSCLLLSTSVPAAAACYTMGGISLGGQVLALYGILVLVIAQYTTLALAISSWAGSVESSLRATYGLVLVLAVVALGPHLVLQGQSSIYADAASWLRCVSPIPAVMELVGHASVGSQGLTAASGAPARFLLLSSSSTILLALWTISRLKPSLFDRTQSQGVMTEERSASQQWLRRFFFLVDPQRRKKGIPTLVNPVMVKEFRTRKFGRFHWLLRLVGVCAVISLLMTYAATSGTIEWGVRTIGGIMVVLQVALVLLLTPSLAASLISAERESGGWELLRMTPLSAASILVGKLASVVWTLAILLMATLPGYLVMIWIEPEMRGLVWKMLICLGWMALFAMLLSATVSAFCRRTAQSITIAYSLLFAVCGGTMLFWLGRDAPFGRSTVEAALTINPMAAALAVLETPGFTDYDLVPANWWWMGWGCGLCCLILLVQTWRLTRPQ